MDVKEGKITDKIIDYIKKTYKPSSVIVYGSYADGSNNEHSDFDALVISDKHQKYHDVSFVEGVQLDVFVYPSTYFESDFDLEDFVRIFDGKVVLDIIGQGEKLQRQVLSFMESRKAKTEEEIKDGIDWCWKMLLRTYRLDAEGMFRWHWVLTDSLEIFCDAVHHIYLGPKKSLKWMKENHPKAFAVYENALFNFNQESLHKWISYLEHLI